MEEVRRRSIHVTVNTVVCYLIGMVVTMNPNPVQWPICSSIVGLGLLTGYFIGSLMFICDAAISK